MAIMDSYPTTAYYYMYMHAFSIVPQYKLMFFAVKRTREELSLCMN